MFVSCWNKFFFTRSCHHQTYQNHEQSWQKLDTFLENKVLLKIKNFSNKSWSPSLMIFTEKNKKDSVDFWCWKMTLKVRVLNSLRRLFIILIGLTMTLFSEKTFISNMYMHTWFNAQSIKKSWTVSTCTYVLSQKYHL